MIHWLWKANKWNHKGSKCLNLESSHLPFGSSFFTSGLKDVWILQWQPDGFLLRVLLAFVFGNAEPHVKTEPDKLSPTNSRRHAQHKCVVLLVRRSLWETRRAVFMFAKPRVSAGSLWVPKRSHCPTATPYGCSMWVDDEWMTHKLIDIPGSGKVMTSCRSKAIFPLHPSL